MSPSTYGVRVRPEAGFRQTTAALVPPLQFGPFREGNSYASPWSVAGVRYRVGLFVVGLVLIQRSVGERYERRALGAGQLPLAAAIRRGCEAFVQRIRIDISNGSNAETRKMKNRYRSSYSLLTAVMFVAMLWIAAACPTVSHAEILVSGGEGRIARFDEATLTYLGDFGVSQPGSGYEDIAFGPDGKLYVAEYWFDRVQRFFPDGSLDSSYSCPIARPYQLAFDSAGTLYVTGDVGVLHRELYRCAADGTLLGAVGSGLAATRLGPDGYFYFSDARGSSVIRFRPDGSDVSVVVDLPGHPGGLDFASNGDLYIALSDPSSTPAEEAIHPIYRWNPTNGLSYFTSVPGPSEIQFDQAGDLIVATHGYLAQFHRVHPDGTYETVQTTLVQTFFLAVTPRMNTQPVADNQTLPIAKNTPIAITLVATDLDGDPLTYQVVTLPAHGTLGGSAPNLTYTPAKAFAGTDSFTFKANDGHVDSNVATVRISVGRPLLFFPLHGFTPYTARISAVFDHSNPPSNPQHPEGTAPNYCPNGGVMAFTGEEAKQPVPGDVAVLSPSGKCKGDSLFSYTRPGGFPSLTNEVTYTGTVSSTVLNYDGHTGYDYPAGEGIAVYAAASGTVTLKPEFYQVDIEHVNGFSTHYEHLKEFKVAPGVFVTGGETVIGLVGDKGATKGAFHLHFTVKYQGNRVDPYGWKGPAGSTSPCPCDQGNLWQDAPNH
jgi:murein DD-endopeptidase MepM/ murein hydrolase activator NlpD